MSLLSVTAGPGPDPAARLLGAVGTAGPARLVSGDVPHPDPAAARSRRADGDGRQHRQRGRRAAHLDQREPGDSALHRAGRGHRGKRRGRDRGGHQRSDRTGPSLRPAAEQPVLRRQRWRRRDGQGRLHAGMLRVGRGERDLHRRPSRHACITEFGNRGPGHRGRYADDNSRRRGDSLHCRRWRHPGDDRRGHRGGHQRHHDLRPVLRPAAEPTCRRLQRRREVTVVAANAGALFTLTCSLDPANAGTYSPGPPVPTAAQTATITGAVQQGDTLVTTINSVAVSYTARPGGHRRGRPRRQHRRHHQHRGRSRIRRLSFRWAARSRPPARAMSSRSPPSIPPVPSPSPAR